jgi:hypothetical protein
VSRVIVNPANSVDGGLAHHLLNDASRLCRNAHGCVTSTARVADMSRSRRVMLIAAGSIRAISFDCARTRARRGMARRIGALWCAGRITFTDFIAHSCLRTMEMGARSSVSSGCGPWSSGARARARVPCMGSCACGGRAVLLERPVCTRGTDATQTRHARRDSVTPRSVHSHTETDDSAAGVATPETSSATLPSARTENPCAEVCTAHAGGRSRLPDAALPARCSANQMLASGRASLAGRPSPPQ